MNISRSLRNDCERAFRYMNYNNDSVGCSHGITALMKFDLTLGKDQVLPACSWRRKQELCNSLEPGKSIQVVHSIPYKETTPIIRKTGASIFKYIMSTGAINPCKVVSENNKYMGCRHYIFRENEENNLYPMMLSAYRFNLQFSEETNFVDRYVQMYDIKPLMFIDSSVFSRKDPLSKLFVSKVIPYLTNNYNDYVDGLIGRSEVRILDLTKYIYFPVIKNTIYNSNLIWDFINMHTT